MTNSYWLLALLVVPLVGAAAVMLVPRANERLAKQLALVVSLVVFGLTVAMCAQFVVAQAADFQFVYSVSWISSYNINFALGVDGIALVLIALSTSLVPVVLLAGWHEADGARGSVRGYVALILVLEAAMVGVFAATDLFLFYVFFEAMLVPVYFLIGRYGGPRRNYAAVKFLLYSLFGGLLMLASLLGLYVVSGDITGHGTFDFTQLAALANQIPPDTQKWLFVGFFVAFAIKAPLVPFHTWLPDAAAESTPGTAVLLVGVLDKVGTFGMLRYCLELFPGASHWATPLVIVLAVAGIIYGALQAIGQSDIKRLIAYTSVSHFGFIALGVFVMTTQGQSGSALYMVNHGFSTAALFLIAGFLISRRGSRLVDDFGGVQKVAPILAGTFLVAGMSSLALPGLSSFVSEFLVLVGTFERYTWVGVVATLGIVLAALYILLMYQRTMTGPTPDVVTEKVHDLRGREVLAIAPLLVVIVALGFYPKPVLDVVNPAVDRVMHAVGATDPAPQVAPVAEGTAK
ncbi:MAG: NADH-quinone oxidoreductase subunit M [Actinomycetales bacterium]|nr:NADH-quinone oxidoreductase subunit M [Actinomycetales bacterium]